MNKILVPTDFSEQANNALNFAAEIARQQGADLTLLHVVEYPYHSSLSTTGTWDVNSLDGEEKLYVLMMMQKAKEQLEQAVAAEHLADITVHPVLKVGSPWKTLTQTLEESNADLIVMGTQGASGMQEVLVGSNTEKAVRNATVPVIAIKEPVQLSAISNIAFASNLQQGHDDLIKNLKVLQAIFNATLHLVRVNTPNSFMTDREVKRAMDVYISLHEIEDYTEHTYNDITEEDGIVSFAEDYDMDMIAIATHGRTGFLHLLSGSVAEDVVNHSKRPVWTFKV